MLNESYLLLSPNELKNVFLTEFNILHLALVYVLMYVLYKTIGRYIYFKPQEHVSKINRTFLSLSLLVLAVHNVNKISVFLPILPQYRWLFVISLLVIVAAPFGILSDRIIWNYKFGKRNSRKWHYDYLPISKEYFKIPRTKSETNGAWSSSWEEEVVASTNNNIHSDVLMNFFALITFFTTSLIWCQESSVFYGKQTHTVFIILTFSISLIFMNESIFSWIDFISDKINEWKIERKNKQKAKHLELKH